MRSFDEAAAQCARDRQNQLTKPPGSLGRLEELAVFMAGWQGRDRPELNRAQALVFAGNHGIVAQGVNPFPADVTALMVQNFAAGGAAINQICAVAGAELAIVPLDLDRPTRDFTQAAAMDMAEVDAAMSIGADSVDPKADILILGEMGIGNSSIAAAQAASVFGGRAEDWVGPGTGAEGDVLARKQRAVAAGIALHSPGTARETLAAFGGREQAAICGAILRAKELGLPVILDGFICTAAAAVLRRDDPEALAHCLIGHESAEPGHRRLIAALGMRPVLSLDMRLGEGSGAGVALMVLRAAIACHDGMATFAEAGIG
ncbi:nicotinate-nucleotide--dimethylbenzimidazole phosphoribosyltransferase [Paracoccus sp. R12_1]|uniref:nicotinate-nucleotide--dimethylbenzimidazole phosphoribosyltransferase n=1 Tax=unclassified Paracoccus (in: a-proteobacteria) TaxID=2688777 RepID=UPI001ADC7295|nr:MULTISPECIES: nicotinate-nucleotide--dimethylbenzimidazole phosphoribosyltransferase [unclassified Paracoccus (in: a-proteobacteria)]MBO9454290.1 nicotinate-nucleotide--dimethylbenzimidazole phosphoribosyltransferase [Paracoccus sp. R12_2]MBO9485076.1 nicotinate-nucleotide--dimethylbenzimidazole phosphoribosyltransferase [Paracoccus sp. R12_1]